MMDFDDMFQDVDKVSQPRQLNKDKQKLHNNNTSLFKRKNDALDILNQIQDNMKDLSELYNELGDGKITKEGLNIKRRNEIIDTVIDYQNNIEQLTETFNEYIRKDVTKAKSLKVYSSTDTSAFDELLGRKQNHKLTSSDVSFQRTH